MSARLLPCNAWWESGRFLLRKLEEPPFFFPGHKFGLEPKMDKGSPVVGPTGTRNDVLEPVT